MLKNFVKIALRNLLRQKGYSFINIFGLTAGITVSCLLFLYVWDELSYDKFHSNSHRIYRIIEKLASPDGDRLIGQTSPALEEALVSIPEIENTTSLYQLGGHVNFFIGEERFLERNWKIVTPTITSVFDLDFIEGNPETAFNQPGLIVSEQSALRLFGTKNVMGKNIKESNFGDLTITGIIKDLPTNSHLKLDFLFPIANLPQNFIQRMKSWDQYGAYTYVMVNDGADISTIEQKMEEISNSHWEANPVRGGIWMQSIEDIYFGSDKIEFGSENAKGQKFYVNLIAIVGLFIILLACINYTNLATARATQRSREIGMRKVNGALRWQLIIQFLGESVIIALFAFFLSLGAVDLLLPSFNQLTGKYFELRFALNQSVWLILLAISGFVGLAAGAYPALYLSKLSPVKSLKGELRSGGKNLWLREGLVIFQFFISIVMLVSTSVVSDQVNYIRNKELGFEKDNMLVIDINSGSVRGSFEAMKNEFSKIPGVTQVATSSRVPGEWKDISQVNVNSALPGVDSIRSYFMCFDAEMLSTYSMELVEGRNFSNNVQADSLTVMINETAARQLGLEDPINKEIYVSFGEIARMKVIGVVKDFNFQSLHDKVEPLIIGFWSNPVTRIDYFSLRFNKNEIQNVIKAAAVVHGKFDQATSMEYHFLDQQLAQFYLEETRQAKVFSIGSFLAIIIASLGLLGLASFLMERRLKEIGVRKILGATKASLFIRFNKFFMIQVAIAFVLSLPVSFLLMDKWLSFFAFRIELTVLTFLLPGLAAMVVAFFVAGFHIMKASLTNPVNILKTE